MLTRGAVFKILMISREISDCPLYRILDGTRCLDGPFFLPDAFARGLWNVHDIMKAIFTDEWPSSTVVILCLTSGKGCKGRTLDLNRRMVRHEDRWKARTPCVCLRLCVLFVFICSCLQADYCLTGVECYADEHYTSTVYAESEWLTFDDGVASRFDQKHLCKWPTLMFLNKNVRFTRKKRQVGLSARSSIPRADEVAFRMLPNVLHHILCSDSRGPVWEGESSGAGGRESSGFQSLRRVTGKRPAPYHGPTRPAGKRPLTAKQLDIRTDHQCKAGNKVKTANADNWQSLGSRQGSGGCAHATCTDPRGNRDRKRKAEEGMSHAFGCAACSDNVDGLRFDVVK